MTVPTTTLSEQDTGRILDFHGHHCPMVLMGARMAKAARARLGDGPFFALFRGQGCALDGIQLVTGCTWGNGNLTVLRGRNFSLILAREEEDSGVLVTPLPGVLDMMRAFSGAIMGSELGGILTGGAEDELFTLETVSGLGAVTGYPDTPA